MFKYIILIMSIFVFWLDSATSSSTTMGPVADKLNVHIVPHTHDDVGWLKTVDQYYYGANNSIQNAEVQYILDSVMLSLEDNPERKFIYVEIAFFKRWWDEQDNATKKKVRSFVHNGQLEFINGGWCMEDEAAPNYVDMIDQTTLGHQFLLKEFNVTPSIGWQIDPFGHSSTQGTLYSLMGMNAWFFGRIDYQDRVIRDVEKKAEVIMRPSASLGEKVDIFTGVTPGYGPPSGFNFEIGSHDPPIMDDERLENYNVENRVRLFELDALALSLTRRTNNIMFTFGTDFNYKNANSWFKNIDKLINYVNKKGLVNAFYSTPSIYLKAKHDANISWPIKEDDWFPYADSLHAFWTGYFTSRPALKGYVRSTSNYFQICRHFELQSINPKESSEGLWEALGVAQHHDAVSGTSKQHVAFDYARRLAKGSATCKKIIDHAIREMMAPDLLMEWYECPLLNQSECEATATGASVSIVAYNPLPRNRKEYFRLPYLLSTKVEIFDPFGKPVSVDFIPIPGSTKFGLAFFSIKMPPMGYSAYIWFATNLIPKLPPQMIDSHRIALVDQEIIENNVYQLTFNSSGKLSMIFNKKSGVRTNLQQTFGWYNSSDGNVWKIANRGQASGAYIFRPNCTENITKACEPFPVTEGYVNLTITRKKSVQEARQVFANWVIQTIRLYKDMDFIEVEYTIGPIPFKDDLGKEIVSMWRTDIKTDKVFYTDSNGRDMQRRVINSRPSWEWIVTDPVSGNFYPVNHAIYIRDSERQLNIMTDRTQGGASLREGEIQLMTHRRTLYDDRRGVGEPINETGASGLQGKYGEGLVITGTYRVTLDSVRNSGRLHRTHQDLLTFQPHLHFTPFNGTVSNWINTHKMVYSGLVDALPPNIHLLSAHDNSIYGFPGTMILRLSHQYELDEDPEFSLPVTLNITQLFSQVHLSECTEMSLTANQKKSDMHRYKWKTEIPFSKVKTLSTKKNKNQLPVTILYPMEIKTFQCTYSHTYNTVRK